MKKILIVDDEPSLREAIAELLRTETEYEVFQAEHGVAAIQVLKQKPIDLMLLDVDMPFLDGTGVIKEMQTLKDACAQPEVVILTNRGDMNTVSQMVELQMFDYLIKSDHSLDEIMQLIHKKLSK